MNKEKLNVIKGPNKTISDNPQLCSWIKFYGLKDSLHGSIILTKK